MDDYFDLDRAIAVHAANNPGTKRQGLGFYLAALTENSEPYNPDKHNTRHGGFREFPKCLRILDAGGVVVFDDVVNSQQHEDLVRQKYEPKALPVAVDVPEYHETPVYFSQESESEGNQAEAPARRGRRPIPRGE